MRKGMVREKGHTSTNQKTQEENPGSGIKDSDAYIPMLIVWGTNGEFEILVYEGKYGIVAIPLKLNGMEPMIGTHSQKDINSSKETDPTKWGGCILCK